MSGPFTDLRAIIVRREAASDDSLSLKTLLETGSFQSFKIPGVLKSQKRSSFHFYPGAIYRMIFRPAESRVIPKSSELLFSPFAEKQDYARLAAVAELVRAADYIRTAPDSAEYFLLLSAALRSLPDEARSLESAVDAHYWQLLNFLGLAAETEAGGEYVAYDLSSGFITAREMSGRPHSDFVLPIGWIKRAAGDLQAEAESAACRELIRKFLSQL